MHISRCVKPILHSRLLFFATSPPSHLLAKSPRPAPPPLRPPTLQIDGNFDDPRLTDYDLLLSNLADLRAGKPADVSNGSCHASRNTTLWDACWACICMVRYFGTLTFFYGLHKHTLTCLYSVASLLDHQHRHRRRRAPRAPFNFRPLPLTTPFVTSSKPGALAANTWRFPPRAAPLPNRQQFQPPLPC